MKHVRTIIFCCSFYLIVATYAQAHFGMVIPSTNVVNQDARVAALSLSFSHPFENIGMDLEKPQKFYVVHHGQTEDLLASLQQSSVMDKMAWQADYTVKRPGVYQFVMEPVPYWEPAEDLYIIHYTKTIIAAFGGEENWDRPTGLPTEIIPLLRPFGNYAGNTFTGKVMLRGKPAPNTEVEVEYYNREQKFHHPSDYHITQTIKTDTNGNFSFTCPLSGWWGFSALNEADYTLNGPDNTPKSIEIGAVLWVYFSPYTATKSHD